ncbi:MAG: nucleotidyltransferase domain-containing protein [Spirochaetia bacterium]|nr:nucleotidyltransferase domain-containing protein [Spirochaetia bacterium]
MAVKNSYIDKILEKLSTLNVYKVILFGSYANEKEDEESDIDLLIVLNEDILPKNYDDWLEIKMRVRRVLREINRDVALDLLVYTRPQYELLKKEMNSFQKEIHESGKILYEEAS